MTDSEKNSPTEELENVSIKIKNYKCFGESPQGFESIKPINIIIGRNNSGKSRLLDMFQFAANPKELQGQSRDGKYSEVLISLPLNEPELQSVFRSDTSSDRIGGNHWRFGKVYIGKMITVSLRNEAGKDEEKKFININPPFTRENLDELK